MTPPDPEDIRALTHAIARLQGPIRITADPEDPEKVLLAALTPDFVGFYPVRLADVSRTPWLQDVLAGILERDLRSRGETVVRRCEPEGVIVVHLDPPDEIRAAATNSVTPYMHVWLEAVRAGAGKS